MIRLFYRLVYLLSSQHSSTSQDSMVVINGVSQPNALYKQLLNCVDSLQRAYQNHAYRFQHDPLPTAMLLDSSSQEIMARMNTLITGESVPSSVRAHACILRSTLAHFAPGHVHSLTHDHDNDHSHKRSAEPTFKDLYRLSKEYSPRANWVKECLSRDPTSSLYPWVLRDWHLFFCQGDSHNVMPSNKNNLIAENAIQDEIILLLGDLSLGTPMEEGLGE